MSETFRCGHPRSPENTKLDHGKWPRCRHCTNERHKASMRERRARERLARVKPEANPKLQTCRAVRSQRRMAAIRRATTARAMGRIEQGLDPRTATQAAVRHAQFALQAEIEMNNRMADPIELAKAILRRTYKPVVTMSVYGGSPDLFMVGQRKDITQDELLALARRAA